MSNGAGKNYGGALIASAPSADGLARKLAAARAALNEIAKLEDCPLVVSDIANHGLEASK